MSDLSGSSHSFEGAVKPSAVEVDGYEANVFAHRFTQIESNQQAIWVYNGSNQVTHACYAPKGLSTSSNGWLLQHFVYDVSGNCTTRTIAYDAQVNYLTASYS